MTRDEQPWSVVTNAAKYFSRGSILGDNFSVDSKLAIVGGFDSMFGRSVVDKLKLAVIGSIHPTNSSNRETAIADLGTLSEMLRSSGSVAAIADGSVKIVSPYATGNDSLSHALHDAGEMGITFDQLIDKLDGSDDDKSRVRTMLGVNAVANETD